MTKKEEKTRKQKLSKKCDKKRSLLVRLRAGNRCEHCGVWGVMNAHHIFSRINYSTKYDLDNGICLCRGCHTMSSKFSAHKTPLEFALWVIEKRGQERYDNLKRKAKGIWDGDYERVERELNEAEKEITALSNIKP